MSTLAEPAAPVAPEAPRIADHLSCDVLIVDDAGSSRELLSSLLRNFAHGLVVREARNGTEALALWSELRPRITLLDIDMPVMNGLDVLKELRQRAPEAFVAMISGVGKVEHVREALAAGASGFVIKPYKPQRILDLLLQYGRKSGHELVPPTR